ncbi:MAG: hypothetical protein NTV34_13365, partial [Proteobacteria bacterium]|nr:hypothetical protein [Pseudomonadota bacterium]
ALSIMATSALAADRLLSQLPGGTVISFSQTSDISLPANSKSLTLVERNLSPNSWLKLTCEFIYEPSVEDRVIKAGTEFVSNVPRLENVTRRYDTNAECKDFTGNYALTTLIDLRSRRTDQLAAVLKCTKIYSESNVKEPCECAPGYDRICSGWRYHYTDITSLEELRPYLGAIILPAPTEIR